MPLLVPHYVKVVGHATVGNLWKTFCTCGWTALSKSEAGARDAAGTHLNEQEHFDPNFPDFLLPERTRK